MRSFTFTTPFLCVAMVLLTMCGSGCAGVRAEHLPLAAAFYPTERDEPIVLDVHGPVEIDVESFGGDVIIKVDDRERQATVRVIRRAVHGTGRHEEGRAGLEDVAYTARMVPGELGQRLEVRAFTNHSEPHFLRAHIRITVPEVEGVTVRTSNGRVFAEGVSGRIDITTSHDDVRVLTDRPMLRPVTILNNRGDIDYRVRGESAGLFDCETIGGRVRHHVRHGRLTVDQGTKHDRLFARLNDGTNPVTLRTIYGDIRIAVVSDPTSIGRFIE